MSDQMSDERIYVLLVDICKRAKVITRCHCARAFAYVKPPNQPPGNNCWGPELHVTPEEMYASLVELANRVRTIADEYANSYNISTH
jgi:hypothetical protein